MNNSLKVVAPLLTIISSENTLKTSQENNDTLKTSQESNDTLKTSQENNDTLKTSQENNDTLKTSQENIPKITKNNNKTTEKTNKTFSIMLKESISVINPDVTEEESFQYSVTLSRHDEMGNKNLNRKSKIKKHLKYFIFKNINYPLKKEDYETFERNNDSISLIVLKPNYENKKLDYHFNSGSISKRQTKIYLLLLNDKYHVYVKKPEDFQKYIT